MTAFNVVKFKLKPGQDAAFLEAHKGSKAQWPGLVKGTIIKTGEGSYCLIGEWSDIAAMVAARPQMITTLDTFRSALEDLGESRGITDAVSGDVAVTFTGSDANPA